jgi:hypothetical protein
MTNSRFDVINKILSGFTVCWMPHSEKNLTYCMIGKDESKPTHFKQIFSVERSPFHGFGNVGGFYGNFGD